jgi:inorganic pyrophosphatase
MFEMLDQGIHDEKILAYASGNPRYSAVSSYTEIPPHILLEVEHFFSIYKDLEGKRTKVLGWSDIEKARQMITACHQRFLQQHTVANDEHEQSYSEV